MSEWSCKRCGGVERYGSGKLEDQAKLAGAKTIDVVAHTGEVRKVQPTGLSVDQLRQVIGPEGIRTPEQQRHHLAPPPKTRTPVVNLPPPAPEPAPTPKERSLFELLDLTAKQALDLTAAADNKNMTPEQFIVDQLVRSRVMRAATHVERFKEVRKSRAA